jgi:hypothetical protein
MTPETMTPTSNRRQFLTTVSATVAGSFGVPRLLQAQVPTPAAGEIGTYLFWGQGKRRDKPAWNRE